MSTLIFVPKIFCAQIALGLGLGDGFVQPLGGKIVFAPDIDEDPLGLDGEGADDGRLDQLVGIVLHDDPVFERARLGLVRVDHQIAGEDALGQEAPLDAGREACAASPADAAGLDGVHHLLGLLALEDGPSQFIAAVGQIGLDLVAVRRVHPGHEDHVIHAAVGVGTGGLARVLRVALRGPAFQRDETMLVLDHRQHLVHIFGGVDLLEIANLARGPLSHRNHGGAAAGTEALHVVQRVFVVRGGLAVVDAHLLFQMVHALARAPQHAGHIGADLHMIVALGLGLEHVVKAHHRAHFRRFQVEDGGQLVLGLQGAIAKLPLDGV